MKTILTIDDEANVRWIVRNVLEPSGYQVVEASDAAGGLAAIQEQSIDAVILDLQMPVMSGIEVLSAIRALDPQLPVIILTGFGEVKTAIEATRLGAYDYLSKPVEKDTLLVCVRRAVENQQLQKEVSHWRSQAKRGGNVDVFNPKSPAMKKVMERIRLVAPTTYSVLLTGETGVGKDVLANQIHLMSQRKDKIFIPVDCGAIPENLIESELFGYEKGAFTGADRRKEGLFELADGGTLFLDELGNLSLNAQAKLLRVLQDQKIMRLGGKQYKSVDVRLVIATNLQLENHIAEGKFREDLYYRLNEYTIEIPPVRERREDIPFFAEYFLSQVNAELGKSLTFSDEVTTLFQQHAWPGNLREMKNLIRAAALHAEGVILPDSSPQLQRLAKSAPAVSSPALPAFAGTAEIAALAVENGTPLKILVRDFEKSVIDEVLKLVGGDNKKTAKALGIHYTTLLEKLR